MAVNKDQERAAYAWNCVRTVNNKFSDYKNLAKSAPALIVSNGLMQTLAFFESKKKDEHYKALNKHVIGWVSKQVYGDENGNFNDLIDKLANESSMPRYMMATQEALEVLKWIRHFAPALDKGGE